MATVYGLTAEGWVGKPLSVVVDELQTDYLNILGSSAGTEVDGTIPLDSLAGQEITTLSDGFGAMWDLGGAIVASLDPNAASDAALDQLCSLTGTTREEQSFSTVTETCTGTPGTVLLVGRQTKTSDATNSVFASFAQGTIAALTAWASGTGYAVGDRRTNANRAYICITAGTSAGSGGPTTTSSNITDNTAHWKYLGDGVGAVDVAFRAVNAGAVGALAGVLTSIVTPVDGWSGAINLLDAAVGALKETDPAFRARREAELAGQGGSTADAIRAAILKVNEGSTDPNHQPPTSCAVFFNDTDATDANGVPPHAVEVLVQNGTDQDITQAVWNEVGAGTATFGNQSGVATDSQGNPQVVSWSRPVAVPIYVTATVNYDAAQWPTGAAFVQQAALSALLTYGDASAIGVDVRSSALAGAILFKPSATDADGNAIVPAPDGSTAAPGLLEVPTMLIGTTPGPASSTTVAISVRQIATFDSSRCTITAIAETP
jgi:uncharacterized phage protein gp47/JayE